MTQVFDAVFWAMYDKDKGELPCTTGNLIISKYVESKSIEIIGDTGGACHYQWFSQ